MKLIDLLNCIPEECEIGLMRCNNGFFISSGLKTVAIEGFAYKNKLIKEQVENMDVDSIYPCASVQCDNAQLFERGVPPLDVKPEIIIEIE